MGSEHFSWTGLQKAAAGVPLSFIQDQEES